jgi:hypothetical protein
MKTRLLRMIDRRPIETPNGSWKHPTWLISGIGYLQPTTLGFEHGQITMRIEGASDYFGELRPCWHVLPLKTRKGFAKQLLAALEWHKAHGTQGPAERAWKSRPDAYPAARGA